MTARLMTQFRLENGLNVTLAPVTEAPFVAVDLSWHVGARHDPTVLPGLAHFAEHMVMDGAARGSLAGATTGLDLTRYWSIASETTLAATLRHLAAQHDLARITDTAVERQRAIISNELADSLAHAPLGPVRDGIMERLLPYGHPYRHNVIGYGKSVADIAAADLRRFIAQEYCAERAALCLAGGFDVEATRPLVEQIFATLCGDAPASRRTHPAYGSAPQLRRRWTHVDSSCDGASMRVTWLSARAGSLGDTALRLVAELLTEQLGLFAEQSASELVGTFEVRAPLREGAPGAAKQEVLIRSALEKLSTYPIDPHSLRRAIARLEARTSFALDRLSGARGLAARANNGRLLAGDASWDWRALQALEAMTADDVRKSSSILLDAASVVTLIESNAHPDCKDLACVRGDTTHLAPAAIRGGATSSPTPLPVRASANRGMQKNTEASSAPLAPVLNFCPPRRQRRQETHLKNGLRVITLPRQASRLTSLHLLLPQGVDAAGDDQPGVSVFLEALLLKGARARALFSDAHSRPALGVLASSTHASVQTTGGCWPQAWAAFHDLLTKARFEAGEHAQWSARFQRGTAELAQDRKALCDLALRQAAFDYAAPGRLLRFPSRDYLQRASVQDVEKLHNNLFRLEGATLVAIGDEAALASERYLALLDKTFGNWAPSSPAYCPTTLQGQASASAPAVERWHITPSQASAPARLRLAWGWRLPTTSDLPLFEQLLGHPLHGRLGSSLRNKAGITYGMDACLQRAGDESLLQFSAEVDSVDAAQALSLVPDEIARIAHDQPFSDGELAAAHASLASAAALAFDDHNSWARQALRESPAPATTRSINASFSQLFARLPVVAAIGTRAPHGVPAAFQTMRLDEQSLHFVRES